jgi:hypothetical protein
MKIPGVKQLSHVPTGGMLKNPIAAIQHSKSINTVKTMADKPLATTSMKLAFWRGFSKAAESAHAGYEKDISIPGKPSQENIDRVGPKKEDSGPLFLKGSANVSNGQTPIDTAQDYPSPINGYPGGI